MHGHSDELKTSRKGGIYKDPGIFSWPSLFNRRRRCQPPGDDVDGDD
jgi:hypothetical protein